MAVVIAEGQQGFTAPFHVEDQRTIHQHHEGAGLAPGTVPGSGVVVLGGPGEGSTVGVGRIGGSQGKGNRFGLGELAVLRIRTQPVYCCGDGELGRAQVFDEVAAAAAAGFFQPGQDFVHQAESAQDLFRHHRTAGDHAVAVQQELCGGARVDGGVQLRLRKRGPTACRHGRRGHCS
jgi:hypothetical protein